MSTPKKPSKEYAYPPHFKKALDLARQNELVRALKDRPTTKETSGLPIHLNSTGTNLTIWGVSTDFTSSRQAQGLLIALFSTKEQLNEDITITNFFLKHSVHLMMYGISTQAQLSQVKRFIKERTHKSDLFPENRKLRVNPKYL